MLQHIPAAFAALAEYPQFVLWFPVPKENGKIDKFPVNYQTGQVCDAHDPAAWMDAELAAQMAAHYGYSIGYVFTKNDPFFFIDIDDCLLPGGRGWNNNALFILSQFPDAAVEVSYSGKGLHIFGRGVPPIHCCKNNQLNADLYTSSRFAALTGINVEGNVGMDQTANIARFASEYYPPADYELTEWTTNAVDDYNGPDDDGALIKKMLKSKSATSIFNKKCSIKQLWEGDIDALIEAFPPDQSYRDYDASKADAALSQHLAFWTGKNCDRIYRLMWQSALVRDKWADREDYLSRTIIKSVSMQKKVYGGGALKEIAMPVNVMTYEPKIVSGYQYLGATMQLEHFKGCVYIQESHRIFTPAGPILKTEQFNATYGGYVYQLDETGDKTTRKAWEAFTESQIVRWPRAEAKCFRPELESGQLISENGANLVNTYVPIKITERPGDPTPFLNHLSKVLPDVQDQRIFLSYMAACIQYKGVKFQWAPLLQGVEGNGKTLFTRCVAFALGVKYVHMPKASEMSEKFNDWLFEKLLIGVEDVYVPVHKQEIIEILKPMITNDFYPMRAMQQGQVMKDNRANFMLNSNHKDGVRKTRNDRRFAVFFCAQQNAADLERDGMDNSYFPRIYDWLKKQGGYEIVTHYLNKYPIPDELNPATSCHRAPKTSSTDEAIDASMGTVEQEIMEAIEEGRPGFSGGWVSSIAVERLLQLMRMSRAIPPNKRRELLQSLGYDWHPALKNGRVNNPIPLDDGKKPILFIKDGHILSNLTVVAEIVKQYQEAQGIALSSPLPNVIMGPTNLSK